jgi:glycosyltransferase involved in cell wall biosynthesis
MTHRVLHVIGNLGSGGAQAALYHLWPFLCRSETYTFELCTLNSFGNYGEKLSSEGAKIHSLDCSFRFDPRVITRLRKVIQDNSFDIVHAHLFPELLVVPFSTLGFRQPHLIYTEHLPTNRRRNYYFLGKLVDRMGYRRYSRIIAINASTERSLITWLPELKNRTTLIPNGVRIDSNSPLNVNDILALPSEEGLLPGKLILLIVARKVDLVICRSFSSAKRG